MSLCKSLFLGSGLVLRSAAVVHPAAFTARLLPSAAVSLFAPLGQRRGFKQAKGGGGGGKGEAEKVAAKDKRQIEDINQFVDFVEAAKSYKYAWSDEELAHHEAVAKEYTRQSQIRHNQLEKDLADKIWLQQEAMRALPANMHAEALVLDDTPPPPERPWPVFDTPPIEDFDWKAHTRQEADEEEEEEVH